MIGLIALAWMQWALPVRAQSLANADPLPRFVDTDCPFVPPWSLTVRCGRLVVAENRAIPDGATLELFVAVLKAGAPVAGTRGHSAPPRPPAIQPDPVLVLPGGPGGSALDLRHLFYPLTLRATRDIILLDPRGSGLSLPSLNCFEVDAPDELQPDPAAAYAACADRLLAEGRDLDAYAAPHQAEDVADLARALELSSVNLYATSYGTRIAVLLAERYPALVRSMVLDGVLPISANALLEEPLNTWAAFRRVAADCAANPACNAAYPALETRLLALVDRYNRTPLPDDLGYGSGDDILALLTDNLSRGGDLLPPLITALYEEDFARACDLLPPSHGCFFATGFSSAGRLPEPWPAQTVALPGDARAHFSFPDDPTGPDAERITWLMRRLDAPSPQALFAQLETMPPAELNFLLDAFRPAAWDHFSEGAFACVICSEEAPFYAPADVEVIAARIPAQLGDTPVRRAIDVDALCSQWPVAPLSPAHKVTQMLSTPSLLLAGTHDPITPPSWAYRTAAHLEAGRVLLFPGRGHGVLAGESAQGDGCLDALLAAFYATPTTWRLPDCLAAD